LIPNDYKMDRDLMEEYDRILGRVLEQMKNLKTLELFYDPKHIWEQDVKTKSYLFRNLDAIKGLEKLKFKLIREHYEDIGHDLLKDYVPLLPKLKRLEIDFFYKHKLCQHHIMSLANLL
jgi:hypothetical protein